MPSNYLCLLFPCCSFPVKAPWDPLEHDAAMATAKTYVSAGNLFWCNLRHLNSPSVPLPEKSLELQFNYFQGAGPEKLREEIVIAVDAATDAAQFQRDQVQGKLKRISPEELDHSLIMYIADLIRMGETDEELLYLARCFYVINVLFF